MKLSGGRTGRYLKVFGGFAIAMTLPLALYGIYVVEQLHRVGERNTRALDISAHQIETVLDNAMVTLENLTMDFSYADAYDRRQPYLELDFPDASALSEYDGHKWDKARVELHKHADGLVLRVERVENSVHESQHRHDECDEHSGAEGNCFSFAVDLRKILSGVPLDRTFDVLLIADENGTVVAQIPLQRDGLHELASATGSGVRVRDLSRVVTRDGTDVELATLKRTSHRIHLDLVGEDYELYTHPIRLKNFFDERSRDGTTETWLLGGLVVSDRSFEQALLVAPDLAVMLGLLLVFGLLSYPFLKLLLMTRRQRLRAFDAYMLLFSTTAGAALATVLIVDFGTYWRLKSHSEGRLRMLADAIDRNLRQELTQLRRKLVAADGALADDEDLRKRAKIIGGERPELSSDTSARRRGEKDEPYDTSLFWMRPDGWQFKKSTIRPENTPQVQLDGREYFRAVVEDRLWRFESDDASESRVPFYVQSFLSVTTGERHTALSVRSALSGPGERCACDGPSGGADDPHKRVVAAISAAPTSVTDPVLPAGFGFAVIDADTKVLYHSDERRALIEILSDELDEAERLESVMRARTGQHFDANYLTKEQQFYVKPIDGTPWWIVTFRDAEILRTFNFEALAPTIGLLALYGGALALVLLCYRLARGTQLVRLWPDTEEGWSYRFLTMVFAAVFGIVAVGSIWWSPRSHLLVSFLVPVMALLGLALLRWTRPPRGDGHETRRGVSASRWYPLAGTALLLTVSILPAILFFHGTWTLALHVLRKHETLHYAEELARRDCRIREDYEAIDLGVGRAEFLQTRQRQHTLDLYGDFAVGAAEFERRTPAGQRLGDGMWRSVVRYVPVYNDVSVAIRYLNDQCSADGSFCWSEEDGRLKLNAFTSECGAPASVLAENGTVEFRSLPAVLGAIAILGFLLYWWLRFVQRRVFFGELRQDSADVSVDDVLRDERVIACVSTHRHRRALIEKLESESPGRYYVPDLEDRLAADDARLALLESLEDITSKRGRVVLISAADPFEILFGEQAAPGLSVTNEANRGVCASESERRRWARLLGSFQTKLLPVAFGEPDPKERDAELWSVWTSCSVDEKLVLIQLAEEGFVNPKQRRTVQRLWDRGLITRSKGALRHRDPHFESFVRRTQHPLDVAAAEVQSESLGWNELRWAFALMLFVVAMFFFVAHRSAFESALGFLSAGAIALGTSFRFIDALASARKSGSGGLSA